MSSKIEEEVQLKILNHRIQRTPNFFYSQRTLTLTYSDQVHRKIILFFIKNKFANVYRRKCFLVIIFAFLYIQNIQSVSFSSTEFRKSFNFQLIEFCKNTITTLYLQRCKISKIVKFISNDHFPCLTSLNIISCVLEEKGVKNLRKVNLKFLKKLSIRSISNTDLDLTKLGFEKVETLDISKNHFKKDGFCISKDNFPNLNNLNISSVFLTSEGVKSLINTTKIIENLTELNIGFCQIGVEGIKYLSECEMKNLKTLCLFGNEIRDLGVSHFIKASLNSLTKLDLRNNSITDVGVKQLCNIVNFNNLKELNLEKNYLGAKGVYNFSEGYIKNIEKLNLGFNKIGDLGVENLNFIKIQNLSELFLNKNQITDASIESLSTNEKLKKLKSLDLSENKLTDKGTNFLSSSECLSNLTLLNLKSNYIKDEGAKNLISGKLTSLKKLILIFNSIQNIPELHKLNKKGTKLEFFPINNK